MHWQATAKIQSFWRSSEDKVHSHLTVGLHRDENSEHFDSIKKTKSSNLALDPPLVQSKQFCIDASKSRKAIRVCHKTLRISKSWRSSLEQLCRALKLPPVRLRSTASAFLLSFSSRKREMCCGTFMTGIEQSADCADESKSNKIDGNVG
jgi:ribosomal protein L28